MATIDYGSDISSFVNGDLDASFSIITGVQVIGESVARRLITPRGTLPGDPNYGTDVRGLLNEGFSAAALNAVKVALENECEKDERVLQASATLNYSPQTSILVATIVLNTSSGPFQLVLSISQVTVQIITLGTST